MFKKILTGLFFFGLILYGCNEGGLSLKIRYDRIDGLEKGNRIIYSQKSIGTVEEITRSDRGFYLADIKIKKNFAHIATEHSKFFIIEDPQNSNKRAIEIVLVKEGGKLLKNGTIVEGSTKPGAYFSPFINRFKNSFENLKEQLNRFTDDLSKIPESNQFKNLEKELEDLTEKMKKSSETVRKKIQTELLPQLKEKMEKLKKQLHKFGRDKELQPLEDQLDKIKKI